MRHSSTMVAGLLELPSREENERKRALENEGQSCAMVSGARSRDGKRRPAGSLPGGSGVPSGGVTVDGDGGRVTKRRVAMEGTTAVSTGIRSPSGGQWVSSGRRRSARLAVSTISSSSKKKQTQHCPKLKDQRLGKKGSSSGELELSQPPPSPSRRHNQRIVAAVTKKPAPSLAAASQTSAARRPLSALPRREPGGRR
nr:hypothetical protein Iba_chr04fCG15230 [Ipomoea batatas]